MAITTGDSILQQIYLKLYETVDVLVHSYSRCFYVSPMNATGGIGFDHHLKELLLDYLNQFGGFNQPFFFSQKYLPPNLDYET